RLAGRLELERVMQLERGEQRGDPVEPVVAQRPDPQAQVDLRGRVQDHNSSRNCSGASCSARRPARCAGGGAMPASAIALPSRLRRWANAACTVRDRAGQPGPAARSLLRSNATSAESTRGTGENTRRDTGRSARRRQLSWTSTETAPYALVPGLANSLSAISRCTITQNRS